MRLLAYGWQTHLAICLLPRSGRNIFSNVINLTTGTKKYIKKIIMENYDELPVYKASYDLLLEIFRFTKEFTKEYKYTIGESLKKETVE